MSSVLATARIFQTCWLSLRIIRQATSGSLRDKLTPIEETDNKCIEECLKTISPIVHIGKFFPPDAETIQEILHARISQLLSPCALRVARIIDEIIQRIGILKRCSPAELGEILISPRLGPLSEEPLFVPEKFSESRGTAAGGGGIGGGGLSAFRKIESLRINEKMLSEFEGCLSEGLKSSEYSPYAKTITASESVIREAEIITTLYEQAVYTGEKIDLSKEIDAQGIFSATIPIKIFFSDRRDLITRTVEILSSPGDLSNWNALTTQLEVAIVEESKKDTSKGGISPISLSESASPIIETLIRITASLLMMREEFVRRVFSEPNLGEILETIGTEAINILEVPPESGLLCKEDRIRDWKYISRLLGAIIQP